MLKIMRIERGDMAIEIEETDGNKRPSLLIKREKHLHSKVGMMMDMERAEEFYEYLWKFIGENCTD